MAHFARLDNKNKVVQVIVINNLELIDAGGVESESKGIDFCKSTFGVGGNWVQTSYSGSIRKNFAGVGFTYDKVRGAFIPPKPFDSWVLNEQTCLWAAPVAMPIDGALYLWDEASKAWVKAQP